ncbi:dTMP kinase [Gordonia desulfuricans]|uniref:Thymidylate kinase n=1 Tax=Gordonia desulfuricans TaxID=89051 RepID=A0A7K3LSL3_9ACTN|nr:dTMP kinase [Gordonia desulfuricans]NDK91273.1 dTMP kinase [Gordonia desulfuricans]
MGRLIAVEGIDGAGKNTLVTGLVEHWRAQGLRVATFAFPRYGRTVFADVASEALHGEHGDLRESVYAMALLFALDRSATAEELRSAIAGHDVVVVDRYVASNAAYSAARLREDADGAVVRWVHDLEFGRFALPVPDRHLLLGVPAEVAMARARSRASSAPGRARDHYERDDDLQVRVDAVYRALAASGWMSPWAESVDQTPADLADVLLAPTTASTE